MQEPKCSGCRMSISGTNKTCQKCRNKVADRRRELKRLGICTTCKSAASVAGKTSCRECLDFAAKRKRLKMLERKNSGLCENCGCPSTTRLCNECRSKISNNQRRELRRRFAEEVCRYCRKTSTVPGKTGCRSCLDDRAEYNRRRLSDPEKKRMHIAQRVKRCAERKSAGLCVACGEPAAPYVKCDAHRGMDAARIQLKQIKKKAAAERQRLQRTRQDP